MNGSKHRTTDGLYESRKDNSGYSSTKREVHEANDESSNHRKYIRTQSSSSNNRSVPISSSSQQQRHNGDREKKTVKDTKKPLRISGDWSEFQSSTGKTYFYNCKTEVSQWEKPKGWPSDESSSNRTKKDGTHSTPRARYKMEENSCKSEQNGKEPLDSTSNTRLPSPNDDSSRMSFSSTSSRDSSDRNEESTIESTSMREETRVIDAPSNQEIQKFYRADLIQHLTDWPSSLFEKQCLKLFDDYYGYNAKISSSFIELKALKSNFRVLEIKRSIISQRLLRCQQHVKERREDDQMF